MNNYPRTPPRTRNRDQLTSEVSPGQQRQGRPNLRIEIFDRFYTMQLEAARLEAEILEAQRRLAERLEGEERRIAEIYEAEWVREEEQRRVAQYRDELLRSLPSAPTHPIIFRRRSGKAASVDAFGRRDEEHEGLLRSLPRAPTHRPVIGAERSSGANEVRARRQREAQSQNRLQMLRREAERESRTLPRREEYDDEKCRLGPCLLMYGAKKRRSAKKHLRKSYRRRSKRR